MIHSAQYIAANDLAGFSFLIFDAFERIFLLHMISNWPCEWRWGYVVEKTIMETGIGVRRFLSFDRWMLIVVRFSSINLQIRFYFTQFRAVECFNLVIIVY